MHMYACICMYVYVCICMCVCMCVYVCMSYSPKLQTKMLIKSQVIQSAIPYYASQSQASKQKEGDANPLRYTPTYNYMCSAGYEALATSFSWACEAEGGQSPPLPSHLPTDGRRILTSWPRILDVAQCSLICLSSSS